jgi:hypothetical protein
MEDELIAILDALKYPVIRQGSLPPDKAYPLTFVTFWNNGTVEHSAYDNATVSKTYDYDVNAYSSDPSTAYSLLDSIAEAVKAAGWAIISYGYDIASDEITHIGRGMQIVYLQQTNTEE